MPAIETHGLRKVYAPPPARGRRAGASAPQGVVALDALDLEVREGEFFGLLGPNGAGKTTTIGILTTRVLATAGTAFVAGADVIRDPVGVRRRIGVVPQKPNPDRQLRVRENLVFHAAYFGIPTAAATARADALLEQFGIADKAEAKVEQMSGGQQQRLMIARALMHEPDVIFLDEPTVGLDPQARHDLWDILRAQHRAGHAIVMTTHYMEEADTLCERVAIVDRGQLLAVDTPAALKQRAPGGTLIEISVDGDAAPVAEAARALPGVLRAAAEGPVARVYAPKPGETVAALVRAAEQGGRTVTNIHLAPPSLETLFISLTGRKLQ
ncbi:MAG TPA: ABC transporter ATP-binding protein [Gemmatimonadaceae bacterium]|nr:ABC transporter ATP-binding protein [Gemmatimonadaceae bacterium]